jgi:hypothetical protein
MALAIASVWSVRFRVRSGRRGSRRQARLHAEWLARGGLYAAPPGQSVHESGRAVDITFSDPAGIGAMKACGFRWGGPEDPVHFEAPPRSS